MKLFGNVYVQDTEGRTHSEVHKALKQFVSEPLFLTMLEEAGFEAPEVDPMIMDMDDEENYFEGPHDE